MPKSTPVLWNYFTKVIRNGEKIGVCSKCEQSFKLPGGSTGSIRYHLQSKHPLLYAEMTRHQTAAEELKADALLEVKEAEANLRSVFGRIIFFVFSFIFRFRFFFAFSFLFRIFVLFSYIFVIFVYFRISFLIIF